MDTSFICNSAFVNNAAVNNGVLISFWISFFFSFSSHIYPDVELLDHIVLIVFWGKLHIVFPSSCTNLQSHQKYVQLPFCSHPHWHFLCVLFDNKHSEKCEVIPHSGVDFHFSNHLPVLSIFASTCLPSICLLWKNAYSYYFPIFLYQIQRAVVYFSCYQWLSGVNCTGKGMSLEVIVSVSAWKHKRERANDWHIWCIYI